MRSGQSVREGDSPVTVVVELPVGEFDLCKDVDHDRGARWVVVRC